MAKMKKQSINEKKKDCTRLILFIPCCFFVIGTVSVLIGNYWVQIADKYKEKEALKSKMVTLREKEAELKVDVEKLENPDYIARYAREKYMYSKEGEIILRIPEEDE
ncbi:MAG: septum formation initiator family protein [Bacilli bacterium]|nr:septum formation initiator family protein [Bacilli bacterium]